MVLDCLSSAGSDESWVNRRSVESDDSSESSENQELQLLRWDREDKENEAMQELLDLQEFAHTIGATTKEGHRSGIQGTLGPARSAEHVIKVDMDATNGVGGGNNAASAEAHSIVHYATSRHRGDKDRKE